MVCFSLAVVQAKLSPDVAREILASEIAIEGLRRLLEQQTGATAEVIRYPSSGVVLIRSGGISVDIRATGIAVSGIAVSGDTTRMTRLRLTQITNAVEQAAERMAVAITTVRTAALLRSRYVVKADQTLANSVRVMKLTI